jgi:hypothetical protein
MVTLVNRAKVSTATATNGTITLGAAVAGYQTFGAAGVTDGQTVRYTIEDGDAWEIGIGVYTVSGPTLSLSRTLTESSTGSLLILSGSAVVYVTAAAADIVTPDNTQTLTNKTLTSPDINGGTIDGTVIGGSTPAAISGTTGQFGTSLNVNGKIAAGDELGNANLSNTLDYTTNLGVAGYRPINLIDSSAGIKISRPNDDGNGAFIEFQEWDSTITTLISRVLLTGEGGDLLYRNLTTGGGDHIFQGEANAELMRITSTGSVGIAASSPTAPLTIGSSTPRLDFLESNGSAGFDNTALIRDADVFAIQTRNGGTFVSNDYRMTAGASGALTHEWRTGNVERMRITNTGSVGIGTVSPSENLDVRGAGTTTIGARTTDTSGAAVGRVRIDYTGGEGGTPSQVDLRAGDAYTYLVSPTNTPMLFGTNNAERMRIDASGNVLIGTTTGNYRLAVKDTGVDIAMINQNDTVWTIGQNVVANEFSIRHSNAGATRLHITSTGNVGIGTVSPATALDVNGTVTATGWSGGGIVTETATQTLTNKTLTSPTVTGAVLNDGYTEEVFPVTGTTPALSPTNGSIQTWALSGSSTPTQGDWDAGQSITLMVDDGSASTINWATLAVEWKTDGGSAPTLNTTDFTVIALWKVGTTIYGARVGDA